MNPNFLNKSSFLIIRQIFIFTPAFPTGPIFYFFTDTYNPYPGRNVNNYYLYVPALLYYFLLYNKNPESSIIAINPAKTYIRV